VTLSDELTAFVHDYIASMTLRAADWDTSNLTETAAIELRRAIIALREKSAEKLHTIEE